MEGVLPVSSFGGGESYKMSQGQSMSSCSAEGPEVSQHLQHFLGSFQPQKEFQKRDRKSILLLGLRQVKKL